MDWIWMAAVAIVVLFLIALCYYFFSDYSCSPCKKERHNTYEGSSRLPQFRRYPEYARPPEIGPFPRYAEFCERQQFRREPLDDVGPHDSRVFQFKYATKSHSEIIYYENGVPCLDLHNMTVKEARPWVSSFLEDRIGWMSPCFRIVTGKGNHSLDGVAILKPLVRDMLESEGLRFEETSGGGSFTVYRAFNEHITINENSFSLPAPFII